MRDDSGNVSQPDIVTLIVVDNQALTAVLSLADVNGVPLSGNQLSYGSGFILNGNRSFDVGGGRIVAYAWTSLDVSVGTLTQNTPVVTDTPTLAVSMSTPVMPGSYQFQLQVTDDSGNVSQADIIILTVVNTAPQANDDAYTTDEDTGLTVIAPGVLANDSDTGGNVLSATQVTGPSSGVLILGADGSFSYTPNSNFNGSDSFTYIANDGLVDSGIATVMITVNAVNDAPISTVITNTTDLTLGGQVLFDGSTSHDPDDDAISYNWQIISAPTGSLATLTSNVADTVGLQPDLVGQYTIGLVVNDGLLNSAQDIAIINVTANLPPVAVAIGTPTTGDSPLTVAFNASGSSDPEGGGLTFAWDFGDPNSPSNSSTLVAPNHLYVNPGVYIAVVTVTDDYGNTDQALVTITVTAPNLPSTVSPTATPPSGPAPLSVQFTAGADDVDGDPLTYLWDFGDGATSTQANPSHVYTAVGLYTATVTVRDGINIPVSASVMIDVTTALPDCSIEVEEYKLNRGGDHDVNGKVSLDVNFQCGGIPAADDAIRVVFDGIELANIRFGDFRQKQPGRYEYKEKGLHLDLDFNKSRLKISRHKLRRDGVDDSNGIEVLVAFGAATAVDHIDADKVEHDDGEGRDSDREKKGKSKESSHKKHRERD